MIVARGRGLGFGVGGKEQPDLKILGSRPHTSPPPPRPEETTFLEEARAQLPLKALPNLPPLLSSQKLQKAS